MTIINSGKVSLEECIKDILSQRKLSGNEWTTAMTVYDVLVEKYSSVAGKYQLVDVREVLSTSTWIEKDDFYYRIKEGAHDKAEATFIQESTKQQILENESFNEPLLRPEVLGRNVPKAKLDAASDIPIEELGLSLRAYRCLKRANVSTIGYLTLLTPDDLLTIRNLGKGTQEEIKGKLRSFLQNMDNNAVLGEEGHYAMLEATKDNEEPLRKALFEGLVINDIPIEQMGLSVRSYNCLTRAGIKSISEILNWTEDDYLKLRSMGKHSAHEILSTIQELYEAGQIIAETSEEERQAAWNHYLSTDGFNREIRNSLTVLFNGMGSSELSVEDIMKRLTEPVDGALIIPLLETLVKEGIVSENNGYYKKVYPSILEAINLLPEEHQDYFQARLEGKTLEEIGKDAGITRERVRQIISKDLSILKHGGKKVRPVYRVREDKYQYLFENYSISKSDWINTIGEAEYIFNYLQVAYRRGSKPLILALDDELIDNEIKKAIQARDDENYIIVGNKRILRERKEIEDYIIYHYFKDEGNLEEFFEAYNKFLDDNDIEDKSLYVTEELKRTRENKLAHSRKVLWKQNRRLRYYDIDGTDFQELLETLDLNQYVDTELSTLKFMWDYPDLMEDYDIRDEYELHNLLKKICDQKEYPNMSFGRMPGIKFGNFNRDDAVREMLFSLAPISLDDLAEAISKRYGYRVQSIKANWLPCIDLFYSNGQYRTVEEDDQMLTVEQFSEIDAALVDDFYFSEDIARIYRNLFGGEKKIPSTYTLKKLGFGVMTGYIYRGFSNASEFFVNWLTSEDIVDVSKYGARLPSIKLYYQILSALKSERELFEFEPYNYINIKRLESFGVYKDDIKTYCKEVVDFVGEDAYFTVYNLRKDGFTSKLDDLGFDDFFYEALLATDPEIKALVRRMGNRKGSTLLYCGSERGTRRDFIYKLIFNEGSIDEEDLVKLCKEEFNIEMDIPMLIQCVEDTDAYYDRVMGKFYANYSLYYEEL